MPSTAICLHMHHLHIRVNHTDWFKTCSKSSQTFLASKRCRCRGASATKLVCNIDLNLTVKHRICWTNGICVNTWHGSSFVRSQFGPTVHTRSSCTDILIISGGRRFVYLLNKTVDHRWIIFIPMHNAMTFWTAI